MTSWSKEFKSKRRMHTLYTKEEKNSQQQAYTEETWCLASKQQVRGGLLGKIKVLLEEFKVLHAYQSTA